MRFEIDGKPKGKERPRFYGGHAYTPRTTTEYEKAVVISYRMQGGKCLTKSAEEPIGIRIIAIHAPNKSDSKVVRLAKLANKLFATLKPDNDNILKIVQDALQGGVAFHDDKQVVYTELIKCYGETSRVIVDVDVLDGEQLRKVLEKRGVKP